MTKKRVGYVNCRAELGEISQRHQHAKKPRQHQRNAQPYYTVVG